jgi:hypothetical protein
MQLHFKNGRLNARRALGKLSSSDHDNAPSRPVPTLPVFPPLLASPRRLSQPTFGDVQPRLPELRIPIRRTFAIEITRGSNRKTSTEPGPRYPLGRLQLQTRPCSASNVSIGEFTLCLWVQSLSRGTSSRGPWPRKQWPLRKGKFTFTYAR